MKFVASFTNLPSPYNAESTNDIKEYYAIQKNHSDTLSYVPTPLHGSVYAEMKRKWSAPLEASFTTLKAICPHLSNLNINAGACVIEKEPVTEFLG